MEKITITKKWKEWTVRAVKTNCVCVCVCVCVCMHVHARGHVQPTLCNPMDCSPPGSSIHGIFQAKILGWVAISFSRGSFWPRDWTDVSCISSIGRSVLYQLSHQGSHLYMALGKNCKVYIYIYKYIYIYTLGILQFSLILCDDESLQPSNLHALLKGLGATFHCHSMSPYLGVFHRAPIPNPALKNSKALEVLVKTVGSQWVY